MREMMLQNYQTLDYSSMGDWLKERLVESFDSPFNAIRFIDEKKQMLDGKLYKYCPLSDNVEAIQHSIVNLRNSVLYMSKITSFNDPFDSYISFSMNEFIHNLLSQTLINDSKVRIDEKAKKALPAVLGVLINDMSFANKNTKIIKLLVECISRNPSILTGESNPEILMSELFPLVAVEIGRGNISFEELNAFSDIAKDPKLLISGMIQEIVNNPHLLKHMGISLEGTSLTQIQELLGGNSPQFEAIRENYRKAIDLSTPELTEALKKARTTMNESYYITCFSSSNDNALMWAHYANKHKGFCIEYNLNKSKDITFMANLHPIIYSTNRASVPPSLFDLSDISNIKLSSSSESTADILCAMLTKSDVWKYENEWRLILYNEIKELVDCKYEIDCIDKVILGCRIDKNYENEIMDICKEKGFHLSKMVLDDNAYRIHEDIVF